MLDAAAWTAIVFLVLGLLLLVIEVMQPGFFIAVPGGTLAFMGGIGLIAPGLMFGPAAWFLWPLAAIVATLGNLYAYKRWAPAGAAPLTMVGDSIPGERGQVTTEVVAGSLLGKVVVRGQTWSARAEDGAAPIPAGTPVRVLRAEGVHLVVKPD